MKRTAEFVMGLLGGIFGVITCAISLIGAGFVPLVSQAVEKRVYTIMISNFIGILISVLGIIFACLVRKKTKVSGIIMIVSAIILIICNFFNVVPLVLFLIAGIMALSRKVETVNAVNQ